MRTILCAWIALLALAVSAGAQGYAWEWSPRQPRVMPTLFVGVDAAMGYSQHTATLPYVEDLITCCTFRNGTGLPMRFAVVAESWVLPQTAITAGLGIVQGGSTFRATSPRIPTVDYGEVTTEYTLDVTRRFLQLQAGARQRLFTSMLSVGVDLRALVAVASEYVLTERVLQPADYTFVDGTREYVWDQQVITQASTVVIEPSVSIQYDVPLQMGFVLSPVVGIQLPLWSLDSGHSWRYWQTTVGLRLVRGL